MIIVWALDKLRPYILRQAFTLRTNENAPCGHRHRGGRKCVCCRDSHGSLSIQIEIQPVWSELKPPSWILRGLIRGRVTISEDTGEKEASNSARSGHVSLALLDASEMSLLRGPCECQLLSWGVTTDRCSLCKLTWDRKEETDAQIMNLGKLRLRDRKQAMRERERNSYRKTDGKTTVARTTQRRGRQRWENGHLRPE